MSSSAIILAFLMGLTGSLHCVGMCGPIIWIMPFQQMTGIRKWLAIFFYHFGRISIYALIAVLLHSFQSVFQPQIQQYVSIALGILLLIIGVLSFIPGRLSMALPWQGFVKKYIGHFISNPAPAALFVAGMLNGLLPCGLVYMALSTAVIAKSWIASVGIMYAFGIGTMPMLIGITLFRGRIRILQSHSVKKFVPVVMLVFGCLFILRGMNLNIPYLSPKVDVVDQHPHMSCCHHKK